jgi:hypothetical protein
VQYVGAQQLGQVAYPGFPGGNSHQPSTGDLQQLQNHIVRLLQATNYQFVPQQDANGQIGIQGGVVESHDANLQIQKRQKKLRGCKRSKCEFCNRPPCKVCVPCLHPEKKAKCELR